MNFLITRTLKWGSKGDDVVQLQMLLNRFLKVKPNPIRANGTFGNETFYAVKEFQKENGAQVDGIVGQETAHILKELLGLESSSTRPKPSQFPDTNDGGSTTKTPPHKTIPHEPVPESIFDNPYLKWLGIGLIGLMLLRRK